MSLGIGHAELIQHHTFFIKDKIKKNLTMGPKWIRDWIIWTSIQNIGTYYYYFLLNCKRNYELQNIDTCSEKLWFIVMGLGLRNHEWIPPGQSRQLGIIYCIFFKYRKAPFLFYYAVKPPSLYIWYKYVVWDSFVPQPIWKNDLPFCNGNNLHKKKKKRIFTLSIQNLWERIF